MLLSLLPFIFISMLAFMAHVAGRRPWVAKLLYGILWVYTFLIAALTVLWGLVWFAHQSDPAVFKPTFLPETAIGIFTLILFTITLSTLLILLPKSRKVLFQYLPLSPHKLTHVLGAILIVPVSFHYLLNLTVYYELTTLLNDLRHMDLPRAVLQNTTHELILIVGGVGLWVQRNFSQSLERLGITPISLAECILAILYGLGLFIIVLLFEEGFIRGLMPETYQTHQLFNQAIALTGPYILWHILLISLAAGIGEELFYRGLLQPAFGLLPTTLLFTLFHSHYGVTLLLAEVFMVGLFLGWLRQYRGTTTAILTHIAYDFAVLSALSFLAGNSLEGLLGLH